jgi:acetyltransferase-like isoleucine patch superfamily enzyme
MKLNYVDLLFSLEIKLERRKELWRGYLLQLRGAKVGAKFGLGRSTRLICPSKFSAGDYVSIGEFSFLDCFSTRGIKFGDHTSIDRNLWLSCGGLEGAGTGFFEIGNHSYIGCNAVMGAGGGGIVIGNNVLIGQSVTMHSESHVFTDPTLNIREQGITFQGITLEDDVWVGSNSTILDGVTVGKGSIIGAGAVVTKSIPSYSMAAGVPAKIIGTRESTNENRDLS